MTHQRAPFDVWAPAARPRVRLSVGDAHRRDGAAATDDWWIADGARRPTRRRGDVDYGFLLDDDGHAATRPAVAAAAGGRPPALAHLRPAAFAWTDQGWTGRQLPGSVIYELHVGTFTPEGTLDAAHRASSTTCARSASTSSS